MDWVLIWLLSMYLLKNLCGKQTYVPNETERIFWQVSTGNVEGDAHETKMHHHELKLNYIK